MATTDQDGAFAPTPPATASATHSAAAALRHHDGTQPPSDENDVNIDLRLPVAAHPTAQAFFDALDGVRRNRNSNSNSNSNNNDKDETVQGRSNAHVNPRIVRATQSLGWRNRHSQSVLYPITVSSHSREEEAIDDDGAAIITTNTATTSFTVRQVQRGEVEGTYGTGATVWPAATVLIRYLERHSHLIRDKHVVDLGSGTGITSIAAAILGATSVVCTDGEPSVVRLARDNIRDASAAIIEAASKQPKQQDEREDIIAIRRGVEDGLGLIGSDCGDAVTQNTDVPSSEADDDHNDDGDGDGVTVVNVPVATIAGCPIHVQKYWWGAGSPPPDDQCTVVLVADCVLPKLYPIAPLVQAIDECLPLPPTTKTTSGELGIAILSYEHRYYPDYDPRDRFRELANERGLQVRNVPMDEMDPLYSVDDIEIWTVTRMVQKEATTG